MQRNVEIDNLRSIAALIIATIHMCYIFIPAMTLFLITHGIPVTIVDLTFVISGYAISSVLIPPLSQQNSPSEMVAIIKIFAVKRLFRIYPSMWAVFFLVLFFAIIFSNQSAVFSTLSNSIEAGLMLLSSTFNFFFISKYQSIALAPYWSLSIEEQFYILFPIFLLFTHNNLQRIKVLIVMILLITFIIRPITLYVYPYHETLYYSQLHFDALMYGCLLYLLSQQSWFSALKPVLKEKSWSRMLTIAILFFMILGLPELGFSPAIYLPVSYLGCAALVFCGMLESNIVAFPSVIQKFLGYLAPRSYTLYLIHLPLMLLTNLVFSSHIPTGYNTPLFKIIAAALIIIICNELLFRVILRPYMAKGYQIAKNIKERNFKQA